MEEEKNRHLACDDRRQDWGDYCLKIYRESVKNGTYKAEYLPDFIMKKRIDELIKLTKDKENYKSKEKIESMYIDLKKFLFRDDVDERYKQKLREEALIDEVYTAYKMYLNEE